MILMLAPKANMAFGGMPSGAAYVSDSYALIKVANDSVADQAALQAIGCYTLTPFGGWGNFGFATLAELFAADTGAILPGLLGYPQYTIGSVFSDGANSGTWAKTGTGNGSGNWTQVSSLTLAGVISNAVNAAASATAAAAASAASAASSSSYATASSTAASQAAAYAGMAESFSGPAYASTGAGIAATSSGQYFAVNTGTNLVSIYLNSSGSAVLQRTLATTAALASTTSGSDGSSLVGSNDGAAGTLWTNLAGFIAYLRSSGAAIVNFLQAGTGSVSRSIQSKLRDTLHVKDFGAVGNAVSALGGISASTSVFTSTTAVFAASDVGKTIYIAGAGASGAGFNTTISQYVTATQVTLAASASTTVAAAPFFFGTDDTTAIQSAITAANAIYVATGNIVRLKYGNAAYLINRLAPSNGVDHDGAGAVIMPTGQTTGGFASSSSTDIRIKNFTFLQAAGANYTPAISINGGGNIRVEKNKFIGCGFGALITGATNINFENNYLSQVGIYPRPAPLDPSGSSSAFAAGFEVYGAGLRAENCVNVSFTRNFFQNTTPASGNTADQTGGAGGFTTYYCDDVAFVGNTAINAPGQGLHATGAWQATDVPTLIMNGTINYAQSGRGIQATGNHCEGSNQEGLTFFGVGEVTVSGNTSKNNRFASFEVWQCWSVSVTGNVGMEDSPTTTGIVNGQPTGALSGTFNIVDSYGVSFVGNRARKSWHNAVNVGGSVMVNIVGNNFNEYGASDEANPSTTSGLAFGLGQLHAGGSMYCYASNNIFQRTPLTNNSGRDMFAQTTTQVIYEYGNLGFSAPGLWRPTTYNTGSSFFGAPGPLYTSGRVGVGQFALAPLAALDSARVLSIPAATATTIFTNTQSASNSTDPFEVLVSGVLDSDNTHTFFDRVMVNGAASPVIVNGPQNNSPAARTYTVTGTYYNQLQLSMASGVWSISCAVVAVHTGNKNIA